MILPVNGEEVFVTGNDYHKVSDDIKSIIKKQEYVKGKNKNVPIFEGLEDFLTSKYSDGVIFMYCSDKTLTRRRKYSVSLHGRKDSLVFENIEISNGVLTNKIEGVAINNAYLFFLGKHKNANNGCLIKGTKRLRSNSEIIKHKT
jgi:hypothetical protein